VSGSKRAAILGNLMACYNKQDVEGYAAFFTAEGCEASYRGDVLRDGHSGIRDGYSRVFAEFPENRAEVTAMTEYADQVVVQEKVARSPSADPFDVLAIYTFTPDDKIARVEFIR
jgi:hypothetical protein